MELTIETMTPADWEAARAIYREGIASGDATFETDAPDWGPWDRSHLPDGRLVARAGEALVGWAALSPVSPRLVYAGVAEVSLYVAAPARGHRGRVILPAVRDSYEDTLAAAEGADLLVSHPICFAARLVAEVTGTPWASTMVTPLGLSSAIDPLVLPGDHGLSGALRPLGLAFWGSLRWLLKRATRPWARPLDRLRAELGLPPAVDHPLVDGHSPWLHLALFSGALAGRQPDWPPQTVLTGFPFHDRDGEAGLPPALARFLDDGPPPVVFTLGCSAATVAGRFFRHSAEAAVRLGRRAVLVLKDARNRPPSLPGA